MWKFMLPQNFHFLHNRLSDSFICTVPGTAVTFRKVSWNELESMNL